MRKILRKFFNFLPFNEEILLNYYLKKERDINSNKNKHLRVRVLNYYSNKLKLMMRKINYQHPILVTNKGIYVSLDGILLNAEKCNRYFKIPGGKWGNEGKKLYEFLESKNIKVNNMIDLGANQGEICLYFSKQNSKAKILAVEPSSENFKILKSNCELQNFSTNNITLIQEAVSDRKGEVEISKGCGGENSIIEKINQPNGREIVKTDTLESLVERYNFNEVDFIKIDIEGAEPLLYDSLKNIINKVRAIYLEVGDKMEHKIYFSLAELLYNSRMSCYYGDLKLDSIDIIKEKIANISLLDLWFIKE